MSLSLSDATKALTKLSLESKIEVLREVIALTEGEDVSAGSKVAADLIDKYRTELEKEIKKKSRKAKAAPGTEVKEKRKLNSYNIFIQEKLKEMRELHPGEANTKHMSLAVALWNEQKKALAGAGTGGSETVSE